MWMRLRRLMRSLLTWFELQTTAMVSMVISRSQVLEKEVFLFQRLDAQGRGQMLHLKAIVFLRPTRVSAMSVLVLVIVLDRLHLGTAFLGVRVCGSFDRWLAASNSLIARAKSLLFVRHRKI